MTADELDQHCALVATEIAAARVVPLLGAGANLFGRSGPWCAESGQLPSAPELAHHLAHKFALPDPTCTDLVRVSQEIIATVGEDPLYTELHKLFTPRFTPNPLHELLAALPPTLRAQREQGAAPPAAHQLIITTNYDDALETAFVAAGEPFDLLSYISDGDDRGRLQHRAPGAQDATVITIPDSYDALSLEQRTVILKIHGAVDRSHPEQDSYVITEDDYIDYLTRTDISLLLPPELVERLRRSHVLFLGYSLRDWNLRAIFHRIWRERRRRSVSWSIQRDATELEARFWSKRDVEIRNVGLDIYVPCLARHLERFGEARRDAA